MVQSNAHKWCFASYRKMTILGNLQSLTTHLASKQDILRHNCDILGTDCTQSHVFKQPNEVSLASFLQGHNDQGLETQVVFKSCEISQTSHWKSSLQTRTSMLFWYWQILWRVMVPGLYLCSSSPSSHRQISFPCIVKGCVALCTVLLVTFSSMTFPQCEAFHQDLLPDLLSGNLCCNLSLGQGGFAFRHFCKI